MNPKVHNKHHRTAPPDAVYVGRGSPYGNPFSHMSGTNATHQVSSRAEAIQRFEDEVLPTLDVSALRGKHLVCFCKPQACHGDSILKKANESTRLDGKPAHVKPTNQPTLGRIMQTFTGRQYLAIDIASNYGLDKETWDTRLEWFSQNESKLEELVATAKEPALFFAGVQAWRDTQAGKPSGYPISLDATSSGLQLLACLTGDRKASLMCNVTDFIEDGEVKRRDAYTVVYQEMLSSIGEDGKIIRDDVKKAVMTALYSSKAEPKRIFGEGQLLYTFYDTMEKLAPSAWELNETMPFFWQKDTKCHSWVMPDNFHVHVKVMATVTETVNFLNQPFDVVRKVNEPTDTGLSLGANTIHSLDGMVVREMVRRCNYDASRIKYAQAAINGEHVTFVDEDNNVEMVLKLWELYRQSGYLSARILNHIDSTTVLLVDIPVVQELIDSLPAKPFQIMTIHDCFRCLPSYGNDLRKQYNLQLALIAKSDILSHMLTSITGHPVPITKDDPNMWEGILTANYALS